MERILEPEEIESEPPKILKDKKGKRKSTAKAGDEGISVIAIWGSLKEVFESQEEDSWTPCSERKGRDEDWLNA